MKLSESQIQELYKFTRKRLVEHYDLQTELVDHLANGIEEQWKENERVAYQTALKIEFEKFGHFGFREIIKRRKKAISKRYWSHIYGVYREYFRLPKILLVVTLSVLLYIGLQSVKPEFRLMSLTLLLFGFGFYFLYRAKKEKDAYTARIVNNQKRWMLEERIYNLGYWSQIAILPAHICNMLFGSSYELNKPLLEIVICVFVVCVMTFSYVLICIVPKKAQELLKKTYPGYSNT